jgi:molecular chaperone GrpE
MEPTKENGATAAAESAPQNLPELQKKIGELEAQLQTQEVQLKEKEQKYLYLYAEFENFKKRAVKERSDLLKFGWESLAQDLLQVIDNLDRALKHMPAGTDKVVTEGLQMVLNQLSGALNRQGVQAIQSLDQPFDPNLHEAVGAEASDKAPGTVTQEQLRGYTLHGRLLRPARVVVSEEKK